METITLKRDTKDKKEPRWSDLGLKNSDLIEMYRQMLLIRRFEERSAQEYGKGKIGGFCHLYIGQEAVGVGAIHTLREDDYIYTSYRDHGQALARGVDPKKVMAELFGKHTGVTKGVGGSMHLIDVSKGFMGGYGIVGGHIPLAAGTAFATKYRGKNSVTLCFFGEAAANQGVFAETLNMAKLWGLPVIFIIENNRYGMGTAIERAFAGTDLYEKAGSYNITRRAFDGMDVIETYRVVKEAVDRARGEMSPTMLEARTYRFRGHSMSDPGTYRTKEEVELQKKNDPVLIFAEELMKGGLLAQTDIDAIEDEIKHVVNESVEYAENSPEPPLDFLYENVYGDSSH